MTNLHNTLDGAYITAVRADYKKRVITLTVEVVLTEAALEDIAPYVDAAQLATPVLLHMTPVQNKLL